MFQIFFSFKEMGNAGICPDEYAALLNNKGSELDFFTHFFNENVYEHVVEETN